MRIVDLRRAEWEKSIQHINKHNEEFENGRETYRMSCNFFTDGKPLKKKLTLPISAPHVHKSLPAKPKSAVAVAQPVLVKVDPPIKLVQESELYVINSAEWEKYKSKFGKIYTPEEDLLRFK